MAARSRCGRAAARSGLAGAGPALRHTMSLCHRPCLGACSAGGRLVALQLSTEHRADSVVVTVRGDLDVVTSGQFDDCLTQARRESNRIILDFAEVDFLDTSCLAVIVGHWKKLVAAGGTLALRRRALPVHEGAVDHRACRPAAQLRERAAGDQRRAAARRCAGRRPSGGPGGGFARRRGHAQVARQHADGGDQCRPSRACQTGGQLRRGVCAAL